MTNERELLDRITVRPEIFGGKPIIRDMRIAVEHILAMLAAGDTSATILRQYTFLEPEDIQACLVFAKEDFESGEVREGPPSSLTPAGIREPRGVGGPALTVRL